ncbi:MAG TPA: TonB-dependent receptor [Blastocatellia bacterium]|nr:TonB-dependent receptor [Blastocatellia bacterium]
MKRSSVLVCIVTLAAALAALAQAQTQTSRQARQSVQGEVKDDRGDVIVGAAVKLLRLGGEPVPTKDERQELAGKTDQRGHFEFKGLIPGDYTIQIDEKGFGSYTEDLSLAETGTPYKMAVTLHPTIAESVKVEADEDRVSLDPQTAGGAQVLKQKDIEALPDDPDQMKDQLEQMAASSGSAPGQAVVTVDGFINDGRMPPKSSIREVRINPDLYSAEYYTPPYQGGRIEIYTKPGAESFHGQGFFTLGDSAFSAREAFAPTKTPTSTRQYGFQLGGPIVRKRSGFFVDFQARDINQSAVVDAITLTDSFQPQALSTSVLDPMLLLIASARADWQATASTALILRYDYNRDHLKNQGVGGFSLPDSAYNSTISSNAIRFSANTLFGTSASNEARLSVTKQDVTQQAASGAPQIIVPGSFISGGAGSQLLNHGQWNLEFDDNLILIRGKHNIKIGVQTIGKAISDADFSGFNGAFVFGGGLAPELDSKGGVVIGPSGPVTINIDGLEQYRRTLLGLAGGTPTRFSITTGNPAVEIHQWTFAPFIQDEWRLRPNLALSMGFRYEAQTTPTAALGFAPRLGVAYSPDKAQHWVLRARAGMFYNRIPETLAIGADLLNGIREQQILVNSPSFPNALGGQSVNQAIPTLRRLDAAIGAPSSVQAQVGLERQLPRGWRLTANYNWAWSWSDLLSRNVNAPLLAIGVDPLTAPRPLGTPGNVLDFESGARLTGNVVFVGANQSRNKYFSLFFGYLMMNLRSNSDGASFLPQNSYDLASEWARPSFQSRHRVFGFAMFNLPRQIKLSTNLSAASGTPFNITTGFDNNGDGSFTDRPSFSSPGVAGSVTTALGTFNANAVNGNAGRNLGTNPPTVNLDLNLSRTFVLHGKAGSNDSGYRLTINGRASNVLNHTNVTNVSGIVSSPFFDVPNSAGPSRRIEFGIRFGF